MMSGEEESLAKSNTSALTLTRANETGAFELRSLHASLTKTKESLPMILRKLRDMENVGQLEFRDVDLSHCLPALKDYMRSAECVRNLEINTSCLGGTKGVAEFFSPLYRNSAIQTLRLFGVNQLESCGSALRDLLRRNRSLQVLSLSCNDLNASARCIAQGLQRNKMLREVNFDCCNLDDGSFQEILGAIASAHCGVKELLTNDNPLTIVSLLQALEATKGEHATLEAIYFGYSDKVFTEDKDVWEPVVRYIEKENPSTTRLRDFSLEGCDIPEKSSRELIKALETNTFLKFFAMDTENESTLLQLLETVPKIKTLTQLVISNYFKGSLMDNFEELLVNAISKNESLYRFEFLNHEEEEPLSEETERKIKFYTARNRLEPLLAAPEKSVSRGLWPSVVEHLSGDQVGPSAIFYCLRKKIDLLPQRVSRKRRQRSEAWVADESIRRSCTRIDSL